MNNFDFQSNKDLITFAVSLIALVITALSITGARQYLIIGSLLVGLTWVAYLALELKPLTPFLITVVLVVAFTILFTRALWNEKRQREPRLEKFTLSERSKYIIADRSRLLFATPDSGHADPIFDVGVSNPSDRSVYITGIRIEVLEFQVPQIQPERRERQIESVTVLVAKGADFFDLSALFSKLGLKLESKYERLFRLVPIGSFGEKDLRRLEQSELIEKVDETAIGRGHAYISPSAVIESSASLGVASSYVELSANQEIPPKGLDRFEFALQFAASGVYKLKGEIRCGQNSRIQLPIFRVSYHRGVE